MSHNDHKSRQALLAALATLGMTCANLLASGLVAQDVSVDRESSRPVALEIEPQASIATDWQHAPETGYTTADSGELGSGIELIPDNVSEDNNYSMRINGRLQVRYSYFDDRSPFANSSANEFELERIRLDARGFVFDEYLKYRFSSDWDSDGNTVAGLTNAYAQWDLQEALGIGWGDSTNLRVGYWRSRFGRQRSTSSRLMQFVDRSLTSTFFGIGRNVGVAVNGEFTHRYQPVNYEFALTSGFGTGTNSPRTDLDNNLAVVARINKTLRGEYRDDESDIGLDSINTLRIGASTAYTRRTRRGATGASEEFDSDPSSLILTDVTNGTPSFDMSDLSGEEEYDLFLAGIEADWKHCGWSLHTEYILRSIQNVKFNGPEIFSDFTHGYYFQGGYFVTEKVELVARHSGLFAEGRGSGSPTGSDYQTSSFATGGGVNFYFRGNHSKLQMDAFYYDGAPINSSSMNLRAGDQGLMFRTQYQLSF